MSSSNSPATVAALVDSLRYDPFYVAITEDFADNEERRREALARYFDYSMSEGARMGRLVVWADAAVGAAVWLLPVETPVHNAEAKAKAEFLAAALGANGGDAYRSIIEFMRPRALAAVWPSRPGICPLSASRLRRRAEVSGRGSLNRPLLKPTRRVSSVIWRHLTSKI